jgi:hypothetical protein
MPEQPFNPLDKWRLGEIVRDALIRSPLSSMPPEKFVGAGIYAIYFDGTGADGYEALSRVNNDQAGWTLPIYVGKAIPRGGRKGIGPLDATQGAAMWERLRQHAETLRQAGFDLGRFRCRHLMVEDIWIPLGETLTIVTYKPAWNLVLDGFGNKDPGKNRRQLPTWDKLHPGRPWSDGARRHFLKTGVVTEASLSGDREALRAGVRQRIQDSIESLSRPSSASLTESEIRATLAGIGDSADEDEG